jgi:putative hydrolase of the HAD superfamily
VSGGGRLSVSFDLDGVLMQNPFLRGVFPHVRRHMRGSARLRDLSPEEADDLIDQAVREAWSERMLAGKFVDAYDWDAIYRDVSDAFGVGAVGDVAELVARYCREPGMIELLPGAEEALRLLQGAGHRLVAITNGYYVYQWPVLEALGIAPFFEEVFTPDRVGLAKPDPAIFERSGSDVHVGDTLLHDVLGPHLAGVASVWVHAGLPEAIRAIPVRERARHASFREYLRQVFESVPFRRFHPEADLENCTPAFVVADALEAARVIVGGALRPSDPEPCPEGEGRFDR